MSATLNNERIHSVFRPLALKADFSIDRFQSSSCNPLLLLEIEFIEMSTIGSASSTVTVQKHQKL